MSPADRIVESVLKTSYGHYETAGFKQLLFGLTIQQVQQQLGDALEVPDDGLESRHDVKRYTCQDCELYFSNNQLVAAGKAYDGDAKSYIAQMRDLFGPIEQANLYPFESSVRGVRHVANMTGTTPQAYANTSAGFVAFQFCPRCIVTIRAASGEASTTYSHRVEQNSSWMVIDRRWLQSLLAREIHRKQPYLEKAKALMDSLRQGRLGAFPALPGAKFEEFSNDYTLELSWKIPDGGSGHPVLSATYFKRQTEYPGIVDGVYASRRWSAGNACAVFSPPESLQQPETWLDSRVAYLIRRCDSGLAQMLFEPQGLKIDAYTRAATGERAYAWTTTDGLEVFIGVDGLTFVSWSPKESL